MIYIQDNTIRDGMQQTSIKKDVATKKKVITEISKSKIHSVEIGMCDTIQDLNILKGYMRILRKDQSGVVLTRLIESSIHLAFQLYSMFPNTVIKLLVPVSKMHITEKLKTREDIYLKRLERILDYSKEKSLHVDMVLEDSTRANREFLFQVLDIVWKQWKKKSRRLWGLLKLGVPKWIVDKVSGWGEHYQLVAQKSVLKRAISKQILIKRGLVSCLDYYLERNDLKVS